jgi:hypothetical protein
MGSSDPMAGYKQLFVSDLDGQHRRQLTTRYQNDVLPLWSPDVKWLAFAVYQVASYTSTVEGAPRSCAIDISNPSDLKFDGFNIPLFWLDRQSYLVQRDSGLSTWVSYTDGREPRRYSPDSILVVSLCGGKIPIVVDAHAASQGLYVGTADYLQQPSRDKLRLIQSFAPDWRNWRVNPSPNGAFILLANNLLELWRVELPSGRKERLKRAFPDLAYQWMSISNDGTKAIYMGRIRTKSKLVVMENPFE